MTRINTNVSSLVAQNRLQSSNNDLNTALTRLSTGLRINSGADDPAGLIASEALRSEITGYNKAISNTQRASQIISTADSALGQVSSLLNDVRGLVVEAASSGALSDAEIAANQLQVDSSLEAINRIAQTTTFQGRKLLDGSLGFQSTANAVSSIKGINIDQANLGAAGSINVDVDVKAAATQATISTTGIPSSTTSANSTGTLTFSSPSPDAEASGTATFANSFTIGAEATGTVALANAFTPNAEATTGAIALGSGATLTIAATDGGAADGSVGNDTIINLTTVASGTASTASYDAGTKTLNLSIEEGLDETALAAALTGITADFGITVGGTGTTDSGDGVGFLTGEFAGGSDTSGTAAFTLSAVDGGAADGLKGDSTSLVLTSGASTSVSYDADNDLLNVTVADGATVADIASAINSTVGADFIASNVVDGDYAYSPTDNSTTTPISGGTDPGLVGAFDIEAVNNGVADGTAGNGATLNLTSGATTAAVYNADTNKIDITVADGATVADIAAAINADGTFVTRNVQNGNALFSPTDLVDNDPSLLLGTDTTADDVITVTADDPSATLDGTTISVVADNSLAAGTAAASLDTDGNIVVNVSSLGTVGVGSIASAISDLDGFTAAVTATDGDGSYEIVGDTAATTTDLAGGVFGGGLNADLVVQVRGSAGSEVFQFEKGSSLESIIQSINLVSDATGIQAEDDGGNLKLTSSEYGSDALIDIEVISEGTGGTFKSGLSATRANGSDINATINGITADGNGNRLSINTSTLDLSLTVEDGSSSDISFSITGGGAKFQLGSGVAGNQQARIGIDSVNTARLGGTSGKLFQLSSGGSASLSNDATSAAKIVSEAVDQVTSLRGRLGAFQSTTLESNLVSLNETKANLQEAESSIRDADFAEESAKLTRAQILVQSGTNVLSLANQNPQNVLALLR